MFFSVLATATLVASILAAPAQQTCGCDVSNAKLGLGRSPGSSMQVPFDLKPKYITLGVGTQNYTCSSAGTYASAGAVATLVDISCAYKSDPILFREVKTYAYNLYAQWQHATGPYTHELGKLYFISQSGSIAPKFDFTQTGNGYMVAKKAAGTTSPEGSKNVDWLELQGTSGSLAKYVFRVDTQGGQPPVSCNAGQTMTVKYTAKYCKLDLERP
ncbi:putative malate dehydrogenase [Rhizoctonia solani 123E]|uniref:Putative malate dehydrogenase n=1 Tax=Rhizoctonia solani 123E TaxID=1423351 RepID=A0A074RG08_9AGAM|nr:putative malate dehydrogenase [Rhizoctonia solani 123E]